MGWMDSNKDKCVIILMYEWRLSALVKDCVGLPFHPDLEYSLLLKLGSKFSSPLPATQTSPAALLFNASLELEFATNSNQLPSSSLQLLVVGSESMLSPRGIKTRKEQIQAIATLPIAHPLPPSFNTLTRHKFDKPADSRANIRVSFTLERVECSPRSQRARSPSPSPSSARSQKKSSQGSDSPRKNMRREEEWEALLKERNQLYKMSESLYEELRKCMGERDEYLRELRERELSEEQIKEEMEFLKLKLQEEHTEHSQSNHQNSPLLQEIEELRQENEEMRRLLAERESSLKEYQRRVKESLIAMDEFRREAVQARTDLIHKQSQLSLISRQPRQLDASECIQELYRQLENRRFQEPFYFEEERYELQSPGLKAWQTIRRQVAKLVAGVMGRVRTQKDKEWLLQAKVALQRKMDEILNQC